ncbi:MAG: AAA family ATPase, partial [Clostridia bacterium]|nr:AAA family ATPase [Clostridia bacterium]
MKIKKLKINGFGNLEGKEIELNKNINIIYGKNEAGKSTLLKFIVDMFYGISKNKRGKDIADFEKYTPWKASEFSGKLNYELDSGENCEIFRDFNKKNPKIFNSKGEDISKTFNIDKLKGNEFFTEQTGIDEELFLSTFVSQQQEVKLNVNDKNLLIQKMSNIVSTGEDNVSYKKAIEKINKKLIEEIGTERTQGRPINLILEKLKKLKVKKEELLLNKNNQININEEKEIINKNINKINIEINFLNEFKKLINNKILEQEKININKKIIEEENKKIINLKKELENNINPENKINKKINIKNNLIITGILIIINLILFILFKNIVINYVIAVITIIYAIYYLFK